VEGLGLEELGVQVDRKAGIGTDEHRRTAVPHIYAVGDCAGYWQLAHTAFREGEVAAENAFGHDAVVDPRGVPRPIYTDPEIAAVGLTEAEAREQYGDDVAVGKFPWVANARAVMQDDTVGWVKSIHETRYGELLGLIMVGPHVTDMIEAGVVAIDAEATVETVADGMAPHPTLSEAIKEAGLVALGRAIHVPNRKPRAAAPAERKASVSGLPSASFWPEWHLNTWTCPRPYPFGASPPAGPGGGLLLPRESRPRAALVCASVHCTRKGGHMGIVNKRNAVV